MILQAQKLSSQVSGSLILYTLTSVCKFSILPSLHFPRADKENLFHNQELLQLVIISFNLATFMWDSGVILKGEITLWSFVEAKD